MYYVLENLYIRTDVQTAQNLHDSHFFCQNQLHYAKMQCMLIICTYLSQYGVCWAYLVHLFTSFFILPISICVYTHAYAFIRTYNYYICLISLRIRKLIYTFKKYEKMIKSNICSKKVKCIVKEVHALSSPV